MNNLSEKQGRYLLFLDILGFSKTVNTKPSHEIFEIINDTLQHFNEWENLNGLFKTIYFSDSFVFYQEPSGYGSYAFYDVYAIGSMVLSELLSRKIPARGAITFGDFEVCLDSSKNFPIYFGKALVEAYQAERRENWIGITIEKSAWTLWENQTGLLKKFEAEGVWKIRETDSVLLLNPLIKLSGCDLYNGGDPIGFCHPFTEGNGIEFVYDILALKFIYDESNKYISEGDFTSKTAMKYHGTLAFLKTILGNAKFEWAIQLKSE